MSFAPIAIVGRSCVLPNALSPDALWQAAVAGDDLLSAVPPKRWGIAPHRILTQHDQDDTSVARADPDRSRSDRGGYVRGFEALFNPAHYLLNETYLRTLDPLVHWLLYTGRTALETCMPHLKRTGAIIGNLSYPSSSMARLAEEVWLQALGHTHPGNGTRTSVDKPLELEPGTQTGQTVSWNGSAMDGLSTQPHNRFMSGLPAHLLATALGLGGDAFALDAACASSLYAVKMACDYLHDHRADVMLTGAVNRCDDLFIHVGFTALQALSPSGQSRPFHKNADGLIPAEGAAMLALKRLDTAEADGDRILGIIRGIALGNDGRSGGILAPSSAEQVTAMQSAYDQADLCPDDISYVECHATGTTIGDTVELQSLAQVFQGRDSALAIGSVKANLGHLITVAGVAGILKVVSALEHSTLPPTPHLKGNGEKDNGEKSALNPALEDNVDLRVLHEAQPWATAKNVPRRAAVNAFGFGGNNAHVIIEEYRGPSTPAQHKAAPRPARKRLGSDRMQPARVFTPIAVVAMGARVGNGQSLADFRTALKNSEGMNSRAQTIELSLKSLRLPPKDVQDALPQQLIMQACALEADAFAQTHDVTWDAARTGLFVGMQADAEVARHGARWRLIEWAQQWRRGTTWLKEARDAFTPCLGAAGVVGAMPNIVANRLSHHFDITAPSFTFSSEELSGIVALEFASRALSVGELNAAWVGAVDLCDEPVQTAVAQACLEERCQRPGDGAIMLLLKRLTDAEASGDPILGVLHEEATSKPKPMHLPPEFGHAHAASGLLELSAAMLSTSEPQSIECNALGNQTRVIHVRGGVYAHDTDDDIAPAPPPKGPYLRMEAHSAQPVFPETHVDRTIPAATMERAPLLPTVFYSEESPISHAPVAAGETQTMKKKLPTPPPSNRVTSGNARVPNTHAQTEHISAALNTHRLLTQTHEDFLSAQAALQTQFLNLQQQTTNALFTHAQATEGPTYTQSNKGTPENHHFDSELPVHPFSRLTLQPQTSVQTLTVSATKPKPHVKNHVAYSPHTTQNSKPTNNREPETATLNPQVNDHGSKTVIPRPSPPEGPTFSREDLLIHASGNISEIFGAGFIEQDAYRWQVRMPEPPLLLADRVTGIRAEKGSMGLGTVWTETDIEDNAWYLHAGRMPAGILIESGQADLFLISYLGIDALNQDERGYRLLGCVLTYHGALPKAGSTLRYEITIDGHAQHGDIRLFFFHYDCYADDTLVLSTRQGQAGFFSQKELDEAQGVLWDPKAEDAKPTGPFRLDAPLVDCTRNNFSTEQIVAFSQGDVFSCFGPGFEHAQTHTRTPHIQPGKMCFLDEVRNFDPKGGPWGRGTLTAITHLNPDLWFFKGHFKNDPCMPGTLMFEGCLQMMAFYLVGLGYTLNRDGWRFEPVTDKPYQLHCRGQATPSSKALVCEIFVREIHDGPHPTLYADLLGTVDGQKAFHAERVGLRLVPDWPLAKDTHTVESNLHPSERELLKKSSGVTIDGHKFDYASLLACAWGKPSDAFGAMYQRFDSAQRVPRLPGPPYHFVSRVADVQGPMGVMQPGSTVVMEYDVPEDAWYFEANSSPIMPFAILLEVVLQPCGWLASYVGSALTSDSELCFRNLDGTGTILAEVHPSVGTLRTEVRLTKVSQSGGMIIQGFELTCYSGKIEIYTLETVFGFFPPAALANQVGLPAPEKELALLNAQNPTFTTVNLDVLPTRYYDSVPALPDAMLRMLDRVVFFDAVGGSAGLGALRAEKDVLEADWCFRAHFFQDPVQPGSLGLEALLQLLQFYMLETDMHEGVENGHFEPIALNAEFSWKYRGQIIPSNTLISTTLEITSRGTDNHGVYAFATASEWVDGKRIYEAANLGMRIVPHGI